MAEETKKTLTEILDEFSAETERIKLQTENDELRRKLEKLERNRDDILMEKRVLEGKHSKALRGTETELHISKTDMLDPMKYRAMKELAARQGRTLRVVDEDGEEKKVSPVKFVDDPDRGLLYANRRMMQEIGIARLNQIAAERNRQLQFYGSVDDLPEYLHQKHFELATGKDRDARLEVG